jgi:pantetheine-phosphate adenylyltransferase
MQERAALFPGSFDPITYGHIEVVKRGLKLMDRIIIGVGENTAKSTMFSLERRMGWIQGFFRDEPRVEITSFSGLTVEFARQCDCRFLLRGIRDASDFQYEKNVKFLNKHLDSDIETIFLIADAATQTVSSSLVREIIRFRGNLDTLVPEEIIADIYAEKQ